ncbi:hypothetical protein NKI59_29805 [Mesorhizobium sp. M0598]|uniref:hypothetical protein n=1 Tax=Mesorhizobium sp. M0598 TaxID=2956968 RepID=UPI003339201E
MMHEKIRPHHLERKAILYVRQSSPHQVLHNRESSALQYAMRERLTALGWSHIETVDDDLGRSAAGGVARAGFDRMVPKSASARSGRLPRGRYRASPATAVIGNSSSRCAASSIPC